MTTAELLIVDTHALVWFLEDDARLGAAARDALSQSSVQVVIPAMFLAEISYLHARGRIAVSTADVVERVREAANARIQPLDQEVVAFLPASLNIHDGLIVATALHLAGRGAGVALVTKDAEIAGSGLVEVVW